MGTAMLALKAATDIFAKVDSIPWQRLYIEERLCDSLAYCYAREEGLRYRSRNFSEKRLYTAR